MRPLFPGIFILIDLRYYCRCLMERVGEGNQGKSRVHEINLLASDKNH